MAQQTDTTVPVRPGMRLDVDNFGGEIVVKAWNQNSIRVQATHSSRDQIDVQVGASTVSVKAESRRGLAQMVEYQISAPAWMNLNLHGVSTDIEVDGAQGAVTAGIPDRTNVTVSVATFNGDFDSSFPVSVTNTTKHRFNFTLGSGSGRLELETFNGDIRLRRPGQLHDKHHDDQEDN